MRSRSASTLVLRLLAAMAATMVLAAGCSAAETGDVGTGEQATEIDGQDAPSTTSSSSTTTTSEPSDDVVIVPTFEPGPCPGELEPIPDVLRCGHVVGIPLDVDDPSAGTHEIAIAQTFPVRESALSDPVLRLQGGPGPGIRGFIDQWLDEEDRARTGAVLLDYRGLGDSTPRLDCPEKFDALRANVEAADPYVVEIGRVADGLAQCRARADAAGIDLTHYDTAANADDIEAVRVALGVERWNVVGVSYGTTVALELLRRHPETVRSAIIDSAYPGSRNTVDELVDGLDYLLALLDADCPPGSACNPGAATMSAQFLQAVERLHREPARFEATDPVTGRDRTIVFDGGDFTYAVWAAICCGGSFTPLMPAIIGEAAATGEIGLLSLFTPQEEATFEDFAFLASTTIECRDRAHLIDVDELVAIVAERPEFSRLFLNSTYVGNGVGCAALDAGVSQGFTDPIVSDVPVLVLAGRYDALTPPYWGESLLDEGLSNARFFEFPGEAHATWTSSPCAASISFSFQADPTAAIDATCIADLPGFFVPAQNDQP